MALTLLVILGTTISLCTPTTLTPRQDCSSDFKICNPQGATSESLGPVGSEWGNLFDDIVNVVNDYTIDDLPMINTVDPNGPARRDIGFCCSNIATCLLVKQYSIPMCWDRFTTNVYFPDGTYGTVVTGDFNTSNGDSVNLVYGDFVLKNGEKGNIYKNAAASSMKPQTATMSMPRPWTSSGEGSAIPATGLGTMASLSTGTTTIAASTQPLSTANSITIIATMTGCNHCPAYNTTIAGMTQSATTWPASTSTFTTGIITPTMTRNKASIYRVSPICVAAIVIGVVATFL